MKRLCLFFLIFVCLPIVAPAQEIPTTPPAPVAIPIPGSTATLTALSEAYLSGDWHFFSGQAENLLTPLNSGTTPVDLTKDYVHLLWVAKRPTEKDPAILTAIVHTPRGEPYAAVLPGIRQGRRPHLFEVFVTDNPNATLSSYYVSKPLPDPLLAQVPGVVDKFLGPLFTTFQAWKPSGGHFAVAAVTPMLTALVREVSLREPRAGVEGTLKAVLPMTVDAFGAAVTQLDIRLHTQGYGTGHLAPLVTAVTADLRDAPTNPACLPPHDADDCHAAMHEALTIRMTTYRAQAVPPLTEREQHEADNLESAVRAFVDGLAPTEVKGTFTIDNSPLTHLSFGLVSAFVWKSSGTDQRAKVENDVVTADALPRAVQMVVLNWSPWGYQEKTARRVNPAAIFRPFAGVVFSPDIGVGGGASFMILSNLGVNIGYARLFISRPENGLAIGAKLSEKIKNADGTDGDAYTYSDSLRRDPLQSGRLGVLFFGVSYNFK